MITLVELGAVFWVGAQFWILFVFLPSAEDYEELRGSNQQVQECFGCRFSLLLLIVLFLANFGVLLCQALDITGGNVAAAIAPTTNLSVTISLSSLDTGVETGGLSPGGKGHFSVIGTFLMGGDWQVRIQIFTPARELHEAIVKVLVPY